MKNQIQKHEHIIDAQILDTWQNPDRVSLTKADLRSIQADAWGWRTLRICGAALMVLIPLWLISMSFTPKPAVLPKCESNCNIHRSLF